MMKLTLPICYQNDETERKEDADLDCGVSEYDVKKIVLYHIDALIPQFCEVDKVKYTTLFSNGTKFTVPMALNEVEKIIECAGGMGFYDGFRDWKEKQKPEKA